MSKLAKINQLYRDANKMCYEVEGNINDVHTGTINFVNS